MSAKECSFIYHVHLNTPDPKIAKRGPQQDLLGIEICPTYHAFILEQYCNGRNEVFTRMYQSFINEFSLSDHFKHKRYDDDQDTGCLNSTELAAFFTDFRGLLLCGDIRDLQEDKISAFAKRCFNFPDGIRFNRLTLFRKDILTFTGISLRYITSKINPSQTAKFTEELLLKYGETTSNSTIA